MAELLFVICTVVGGVAAILLIALAVTRESPAPVRAGPADIVELGTNPAVRPVRHLGPGLIEALHVQKAVARQGGSAAERLVILSDASLALFPGEVVCVSGKSGRGKSTLLDIMALHEPLTAGEVRIGATTVSALGRADRDDMIARYIHYIPQDTLALLGRSPVENIVHALTRLDRVDLAEARWRAEAALRLAGVAADKFHQPLAEAGFSGGQRARVAIAVAFARAKPIVLADEIFSSIDQPSAAILLEQFRVLARREQGAVAIISHDQDLWPLFDRHVGLQGHDPSLDAERPA